MTKILVLDIERQSAIVQGVWALKQHGYIRPDQILVPTRTICFAWKWHGDSDVQFSAEWDPNDEGPRYISPIAYKKTGLLEDYHVGHTAMILKARDLLNEADYVVGWNSKPFDIPNLRVHIAEQGFPPPSPHIDIDLIKTSRSQFGFMSHKLEEAATHFGLGKKAASGGGLWEQIRWARGQEFQDACAKMRLYNIRDVELTEQMFDKMLPWIPGLNIHGDATTDHDIDKCRRCGSTNIRWEGTRRAITYWYKRFQCKDCLGWGRSTKNYFSMGTSS